MKLTIIFKDEFEEHMKKTVWAFHESASLWREVRTHGRWVSMLHNLGHEALEYEGHFQILL